MNVFGWAPVRQSMRAWLLLAIGVLMIGSASAWGSLFAPRAAAAGNELRIKSVKVSVWPEYDDPRLLVIYEGEFADGGTFPRDVSFKAPRDAAIQMACALTARGDHQCQAYDTTVEGDYKIITFKLPIPTFYFEYYGSGIEGTTDRTINYQFFNPPYAIDDLNLVIQQPLKATNFAINPSTAAVTSDAKGFKYYDYKLGTVPADKALNFAVSYIKSDPNPSVEKKSAADPTGPGGNGLLILGSIGGMAIVLGASYWISSKRNQKKYASRTSSAARMRPTQPPDYALSRSASRPTSESGSTRSGAPAAAFCAKCGTRLGANSAFCSHCGELAKR